MPENEIQRDTAADGNFKKRRRHKPKRPQISDGYVPSGKREDLDMTIEELGLSEKTYQALKAGKVDKVRDIAMRRMSDMYKIKNIGKKDCFEILRKLSPYGIRFREDENSAEKGDIGDRRSGDRPTFRKGDGGRTQPDQGNRRQRDGQKFNADKDRQRRPVEPPKEKRPDPKPEDDDYVTKFFRKGKWGFRDFKRREVIAPVFDEAFNFREGLACVEKDEKMGYIDRSGELVIPYLYDAALSFSEGLASVTLGEKSGYIDKEGNVVFPIEFDNATSFANGRAIIKKEGKWGFLDRESGDIRWR